LIIRNYLRIYLIFLDYIVMSSSSLDEQIDKNTYKSIEELYKKIDKNTEFEVMFFNYKQEKNKMGLENFLKILEYLTFKSKKESVKLLNTVTLDITYTKKVGESYRITINTIKSINKYIKMLHLRKNHVIFSVLAGLLDKDETLTLIKKVKERENIIDLDDYDMRVRLSEETSVSKKELEELIKLDDTSIKNINFRYKQRVSLMLEDKKDLRLSIDLTNVKMTNNMNRIEKSISSYELEIDLTTNTKSSSEKYLKTIFSEANILLKIVQQSNFIVSRTLENEVLENYAKLLNVDKNTMISLEARRPQSLEVQHVINQLPNKYAVTDKADGERYVLIIHNNKVYLISDLLNVKYTGIVIPESKANYNNSIIDGELIFIQSHNKYVYMGFDCLYVGNKDIRQVPLIMERLKNLDEIIEKCFINKEHKGYKFVEYKKKFDMNDIIKFHEQEIKKFLSALNQDILVDKQLPLIRRKYFIPVQGGADNEIFNYSTLIWNKYVKDDAVKCPYILDGLIYHPLDQKYIVSIKDSKYIEYKWKPEEKNSLDFYVQYERSRDTGNIVTLYDNSQEEVLGIEEAEKVRDKPYKVLYLYVGKTTRNIEQPVLFEPEKDSIKHMAYIYLRDGEVRDLQDNIIQDNTVVEFYYNNDPNIPDKTRWVPIRTRYDKTESVLRFGKKYGNYVDIAYRIWRSIRNPVTMNDFEILTKPDMYTKHIDILRNKIDHSIILSEKKEDIYYQIRTTLGKPMRNFHNWVKDILIHTYDSVAYQQSGKNLSIFDIGCGRGGDIMKHYYDKIDFYVGIDIDNNGIISPGDGALSRYQQLRKTHPNFPRMFFIQADGGTLLNYEDQAKALGNMSPKNKDLIEQFFSKDPTKRIKFDRISCQFAVHYFFENEIVFNNFTQNINDSLKDGGYLIITTFDADRIVEILGDKAQYTEYYTNQNGEQKVLFDVVKKYDNIKKGDKIGLGIAIDFHNALDFQEGNYKLEYLVQKDFIQEELLKKCDLELDETELFENLFIMQREFFAGGVYKYESVEKTRKFLGDAAEFYKKSDINNACFQLSRLYRCYAFRKKDKQTEAKPESKKVLKKVTKKTQKGGEVKITHNDYIFNEAPDIINPTKFIKRDIAGMKDYSFMLSIHDILKTHDVIPENVSIMEFCDDIDNELYNDGVIDSEKIQELNSHLVIKHDYTDSDISSELALNGVNILVIKKDCDGNNIDRYGCGKKGNVSKVAPTIILYHDGAKYYPIYKVKGTEYVGLYNSKMAFVNDLFKKFD
jgi:SAM-dependent methyltransferase